MQQETKRVRWVVHVIHTGMTHDAADSKNNTTTASAAGVFVVLHHLISKNGFFTERAHDTAWHGTNRTVENHILRNSVSFRDQRINGMNPHVKTKKKSRADDQLHLTGMHIMIISRQTELMVHASCTVEESEQHEDTKRKRRPDAPPNKKKHS